MTGATFSFVALGAVVASLFAISASPRWRALLVLGAAAMILRTVGGGPATYLPLAGFTALGFVSIKAAGAGPGRHQWVPVALLLVAFVWIKRYAFVPSGVLLPVGYVTLGLSYMLFRALHILLEARTDPSIHDLTALEYTAYLCSFNTLVSGPIQTYHDYQLEQQAAVRRPGLSVVAAGAERVVAGMFKANVLAPVLVRIRESAMQGVTAGGGVGDAMLVFGLYPFFLYLNFSGYIDVVVGVSRWMNWTLPENFDRPFTASSVIDFWNRWHITLTTWLRTYVYNPLLLGLLRRFPDRRLEGVWASLAFFVTFFLIGVWHGQTTAFLFFGVLCGFGISVNKAFQSFWVRRLGRRRYEGLAGRPAAVAAGRGLTLVWFAFTLTWFWSSWDDAAALWRTATPIQWVLVWGGLLVGFAVVGLVAAYVHEKSDANVGIWGWWNRPLVRTARTTAALVVVAAAAVILSDAVPQIVYKDF